MEKLKNNLGLLAAIIPIWAAGAALWNLKANAADVEEKHQEITKTMNIHMLRTAKDKVDNCLHEHGKLDLKPNKTEYDVQVLSFLELRCNKLQSDYELLKEELSS